MRRARAAMAAVGVGALLWAVGFFGGRAARDATPELAWEPPPAVAAVLPAAPRAREPEAVPTLTNGADEGPGPHALPPTRLHPRDPGEWQGMQVDLSQQAVCEEGALCGQAMACVEGQCGPCERDGQCGIGEACVLDHCVAKEQVACRTRRDCAGPDELCVLSGLSSGARGNETMRAYCSSGRGGETEAREETETASAPSPELPVKEPMAVPLQELMQAARAQ